MKHAPKNTIEWKIEWMGREEYEEGEKERYVENECKEKRCQVMIIRI